MPCVVSVSAVSVFVFLCISLYIFVYLCISFYFFVSLCISLYIFVFICISLYFSPFAFPIKETVMLSGGAVQGAAER